MKKFLLLFALVPAIAHGQATCSQSDVQTAVTAASNGATVTIPAGTCTWTSQVSWSGKGITLIGTGTPNSLPSQFGAGSVSTHIILNTGSSVPGFQVTGMTFGQTSRISTLDIEPNSSGTALWSPISVAGTCSGSGCPQFRVDNIIFGQTTQWTESGNGAQATSMIRTDNVYGVIDHVTVPTNAQSVLANISHSAWLGAGGFGDNSWAQADSQGTPAAVYLENNSFANFEDMTDSEFAPAGGGIGGGRWVGRFNHVNSVANSFGTFNGHGLDTNGRPQGMRQVEAYGNVITITGGAGNTACISARAGGVGHCWGNTFNSDFGSTGGFYNAINNITTYRIVDQNSSFGTCDGTSAWDTNTNIGFYSGTATSSGLTFNVSGSPGWTTNQLIPNGAPFSVHDVTQNFGSEIVSNGSASITIQGPVHGSWTQVTNGDTITVQRATVCADQGGRGAGNLISGSTPSPSSALSQALDPMFDLMNSYTAGNNPNQGITTSDTLRSIGNRDWYDEPLNQTAQTTSSAPFNGASGAGHGTLARMPTTCTTGVIYLATDQGTWNTSGNGFGQGQFKWCSTTNTWSALYEPYTYPHPLISGTVAMPTCTPSTLSAPGFVTCGSSTSSSSTFYTVNGTTPTTGSTQLTHSYYVGSTQTIQMISSASGLSNSAVGSQAYSFAASKTSFNLSTTSSSTNPVPFPPVNRACCGSNVTTLEASRGTYTLTTFHNWITQTVANGQKFWYTIQGFPPWMTGLGANESAPPTDLNASAACQNVLTGTTTTDCSMKEFVTKLMEDRTGLSSQPVSPVTCTNLDYLEVINEFNTDSPSGSSTGWTGTYADLATLANDISGVVHSWCSNTVVVGGSASGIVGFHSNGENAHFDVALETLLADWAGISGASLPDAVSWHPYPARGTVSPVPFPTSIVSNSDSACTSGNTPNVSCYIKVSAQATQITGAAVLQNAAIQPWAKFLPVLSSEGGFGTLSQLCSLTSGSNLCQGYVSEYMLAIAAQPVPIAMLYAANDSTWGCYWNCGSGLSAWYTSFSQTQTWLNGHAITGALTSTAITGGNKWSLQLDSGAAEIDFCDAWLANCSTTTAFNTQQNLAGAISSVSGSLTLTQSPVLLFNSGTSAAPTLSGVVMKGVTVQ